MSCRIYHNCYIQSHRQQQQKTINLCAANCHFQFLSLPQCALHMLLTSKLPCYWQFMANTMTIDHTANTFISLSMFQRSMHREIYWSMHGFEICTFYIYAFCYSMSYQLSAAMQCLWINQLFDFLEIRLKSIGNQMLHLKRNDQRKFK